MIYNYAKITNPEALQNEITASSITIVLVGVSVNSLGTDISFKASLSQAEIDLLDSLVSLHDASITIPPKALGVVVEESSPIQLQPFADSGGFRFRGASFEGTITANSTESIEYKLTQERFINGGRLMVENRGIDDKVSFQVVDVNNVLGLGAGVVLDEFIKDFFVPENGSLEVSLAYPARILAGLFIRLVYTSTHGSSTKLKCNLYLHLRT